MEFDINEFIQTTGAWVIGTGLQILLIVVLLAVFLRLSGVLTDFLLHRLKHEKMDLEMQKRIDTLSGIIRTTLNVVLFALGVMMILSQLGVEVGPILGAAGVLGLAVGFGAKNLVEDVISGFFILLEDQIRVGDVVDIAGKGGLVEKINLRMVIMRDLAGNVHYVRNGQIGVVTNMTKEYSRYVFDIGVAYREDVDEVIKVIKEVDAELREDEAFKDDILEPIEILGLDKFGDSAVIVKARTKTLPIKQWNVGREFNKRLKKRFDEKEIEIPFPHRTIYIGQDKEGRSPALNIHSETAAKD